MQSHNGRHLKCVSSHRAFPRGSRESASVLDVHYAPSVRLERGPVRALHDLEADVDSVREKAGLPDGIRDVQGCYVWRNT